MTKLTEHTVLARTRAQDLKSVRKLNAWGSELTDVSIVKNLPNVEVLSLSVNNISSLQDFAHCKNLQELYLRKNKIMDLSDIRYLKDLSNLHSLWLADNPCAEEEHYRLTVIRNLPQLLKLDNQPIAPGEDEQAKLHGFSLDDLQQSAQPLNSPNEKISSDTSMSIEASSPDYTIETVRPKLSTSLTSPTTESFSAKIDDSLSCSYVEESNSSCMYVESEQIYEVASHQYYNGAQNTSPIMKQENISKPGFDQDLPLDRPDLVANEKFYCSPSVPSGKISTTRPERTSALKLLPKGGRNRNANILSAVLCLIKELDLPSLEVVDTAVHCQMEDLEAEDTEA